MGMSRDEKKEKARIFDLLVNSYGASYEAGDDGSLSIGSISATEMAGPEPAMQAEATYLELLQRVRAYKVGDGELTLLDGNGNELLIFAVSEGRRPAPTAVSS